jgi:hypothetical protein
MRRISRAIAGAISASLPDPEKTQRDSREFRWNYVQRHASLPESAQLTLETQKSHHHQALQDEDVDVVEDNIFRDEGT